MNAVSFGDPLREAATHLAATRTFSLLEPGELAALGKVFAVARYSPGQVLAREGEVDATLRIVVAGSVALHRDLAGGGREHADHLGYGGVLGEGGLFAALPRSTTAVALRPTTVLYADRDALWAALAEAGSGLLDRLVLPDPVRLRLTLPSTATAHQGERTVAVVRRHWSVLAGNMVVPAAMAALSLLVAGTLASFAASPGQVLVLVIVAVGVPAGLLAFAYLDWRYDVLIVTNRRVVHIDRTPLLRSRRSEAPLPKVQDVEVVTPDLVARSLGFGDLKIQTAGRQGAIAVASIPAPEEVRAIVFREAAAARAGAHRERAKRIEDRLQTAMKGDETVAPMPGIGEAPADGAPGRRLADSLGALLPRTRVERRDGAVVWRKHWWVLARHTWLVALALVAAGAALARTVAVGGPIPARWWAMGTAVLALWAAYRYEDWRNDLYILTDEHIVDVERRPLGLRAERRQARLGQIQDIRLVVPNPLATYLGYGDVVVETAAETGRFTFDRVHNPEAVAQEIFARLDALREREVESAEERRADELTHWFREYHRLAGPAASPAE